jgi:hypothetical protein
MVATDVASRGIGMIKRVPAPSPPPLLAHCASISVPYVCDLTSTLIS